MCVCIKPKIYKQQRDGMQFGSRKDINEQEIIKM